MNVVSEQVNAIVDSDCDESGGVLPLRRQQRCDVTDDDQRL